MKFTGKFNDTDLEVRFRQDENDRNHSMSYIIILLTALFQMFSLPADSLLLKGSSSLPVVFSVRFFSISIAVITFFLIRRIKSVSTFENIIFAWVVLELTALGIANAMLPEDYTIHIGWDILLSLTVYTVVPLPLRRQMIAVVMFSIVDVAIFWQHKSLGYPGAFFDVFTAFVCANSLGVFASWELGQWRRQQFKMRINEEASRFKLEKALMEIKTLKGILPICAHCKKIRDDDGYWNTLERYIQDNSDAKFSHGICAECATELYPDIELTHR